MARLSRLLLPRYEDELQPDADCDDHELVEHVEHRQRDCDLRLSARATPGRLRFVVSCSPGVRACRCHVQGLPPGARACHCSCSSCSHVNGVSPLDLYTQTQSTRSESDRKTQKDRIAPSERT